jgi:hypothetical protein
VTAWRRRSASRLARFSTWVWRVSIMLPTDRSGRANPHHEPRLSRSGLHLVCAALCNPCGRSAWRPPGRSRYELCRRRVNLVGGTREPGQTAGLRTWSVRRGFRAGSARTGGSQNDVPASGDREPWLSIGGGGNQLGLRHRDATPPCT